MAISKRIYNSRLKELNKRGPFVIQIEGQLNFFSRPYSAIYILLDSFLCYLTAQSCNYIIQTSHDISKYIVLNEKLQP